MMEAVTSTGRLDQWLLPAVYFGASVLIDYWLAQGMVHPEHTTDEAEGQAQDFLAPLYKVVYDLLNADVRPGKVAEIRRRSLDGNLGAVPVTTHAALWELQEWFAASAFRNATAVVTDTGRIPRKGTKEIDDHLRKAFVLWQEEVKADEQDCPVRESASGIEWLLRET